MATAEVEASRTSLMNPPQKRDFFIFDPMSDEFETALKKSLLKNMAHKKAINFTASSHH